MLNVHQCVCDSCQEERLQVSEWRYRHIGHYRPVHESVDRLLVSLDEQLAGLLNNLLPDVRAAILDHM